MTHIVLTRMTIDQPSASQRWHALHGTRVLVNLKSTLHSNAVTIWFLEGSIISQNISRDALVTGWRPIGLEVNPT